MDPPKGPMDQFLHESKMRDLAVDDESSDEEDAVESDTSGVVMEQDMSEYDKAIIQYLQGNLSFTDLSSVLDDSKAGKQADDNVETLEEVTLTPTKQKMADIASSAIKQKPEYSSADEEMRPRRRRSRGRLRKLPKHLQGLMGEANLKFARGELEEASKMCMEVIRLAPHAPEPFQTLGMLYEEMGNMEKSLQYSLIAAHLDPKDSEEWIKLAEMSLELGEARQAATCLGKAIRCDPKNVALIRECCSIYENLGEYKKAQSYYLQVMSLLPPDEGEDLLILSRDLTKSFHKSGNISKAVETMAEAVDKYPKMITSEDVNFLVELQFSCKDYIQGLKTLVDHCGIVLHTNTGQSVEVNGKLTMKELQDGGDTAVSCTVPEALPIDLRVKLTVGLIHLGYMQPIEKVVAPLYEEKPDDMGDLYLDVAEAYMDKGEHTLAQSILKILVASKNYNLAAVWLKYAECLNANGELQQAVQAYKKVVESAPNHMGARVSLSNLQQQLGRPDEALSILSNETGDTKELNAQDMRLLLHRCMLLISQNKLKEGYICAMKLLYSYPLTPWIRKNNLNAQTYRNRYEEIRNKLGLEFEEKMKQVPALKVGQQAGITPEDLWELYLKVHEALLSAENYDDALDWSAMALTNPALCKEPEREQNVKEVEWHCLLVCILKKDGQTAYKFIRELLLEDTRNNCLWNIFRQVIEQTEDIRHNRFLLRMMIKYPDNQAIGILNGHNSMLFGTYKSALGEYVSVYRQNPDDPLINLCIGMTFVNIASQKFSTKRHALILQGIAFFNRYKERRGECQEVYYNIGRALQQLGLFHAAIYYYEEALKLEPAVCGEQEEIFDLRREVAYNLHLIYKNSGSTELAQMLLQKYCVV